MNNMYFGGTSKQQMMRRRRRCDDDDDEDEPPKINFSKMFASPQSNENTSNHIYLDEAITEDVAKELCNRLRSSIKKMQKLAIDYEIDPPKIYLHINNCPGGLVGQSFTIIDIIRQSKVPIVTIIEGESASAATLISVNGHERYITEHGYMLIHELRGGFWGKASDIEDDHDNIKECMRRIKNIYIRNSNLTDDELMKYLKHDIYWSAKDCLDNGLVDKILCDNDSDVGNCIHLRKKRKRNTTD
jgi:ATP-dependent protease ClpP protease subunit